MASNKEYLYFVLEQLSKIEDISYRVMMGEYILYYKGKVFGGVYDNRFLVKPTKSAVAMMSNAKKELPYSGAKEMLLVDNIENKEFLKELLETMYEELPAPKKKKYTNRDRRR
ncbi:MAG: TfoX/Sxy family protein [Clostridia bacterium]|nr:TfoX/Sxy family protein [Clostridia bacterium]